MKIRSNIKAGGIRLNHNEKMLVVKTGVRAGGIRLNHNQKMVGR
jgi:hypothetical protein